MSVFVTIQHRKYVNALNARIHKRLHIFCDLAAKPPGSPSNEDFVEIRVWASE